MASIKEEAIELARKLEAADIEEDELDLLVLETGMVGLSNINNAGLVAQCEFLIDNGIPPSSILAMLHIND